MDLTDTFGMVECLSAIRHETVFYEDFDSRSRGDVRKLVTWDFKATAYMCSNGVVSEWEKLSTATVEAYAAKTFKVKLGH